MRPRLQSIFRSEHSRRRKRKRICVKVNGRGSGTYWRSKKIFKKPPKGYGFYKIGFKSYKGYLKSSMWKVIREMVLNRDQCGCFCCGRNATQVHHCDYHIKTMLGVTLGGLRSLCPSCHQEIEFDLAGNKRELKEANQQMAALKTNHLACNTA